MADILERLRRKTVAGQPVFSTPLDDAAAAEIERLRARLAEAERDAARYRWLRTERGAGFWGCHEKDGDGGQILRYEIDLDAAIDAAMGESHE